jgi:hypothetical protein
MTRHHLTGLALGLSLTVAAPVGGAQDPRPEESDPAAVRLRVDTLASFINHVAGFRVRVISGVVDEIASPRLFILTNDRSTGLTARPSEVAILVRTGRAVLREDAPVVVTGIARTSLGAEMTTDQPRPALTESERDAMANRPVVIASAVETPGGVNLIRADR